MKKWIAFMLILVLGVVFIGCDTDEKDPDDNGDDKQVVITGINISGNLANMNVGDTMQLSATVTPENADQSVKWLSKNPEIATVDENTGLVTAISAGVVDIVVTSTVSNKITRQVSILVIQPIVYEDPTSVKIEAPRFEFNKGSFINLKVTVFPVADKDAGTDGADQAVMWTTSDASIATVDTNGRVTGVGEGRVTITATVVADLTLTDSVELDVVEYEAGELPTDPTGLQIRGEGRLEEGYELALLANVTPSGVSQNVRWSSSNEELATVNSSGIVTALKAGTVYIVAESAVKPEVNATHKIDIIPKIVLPDRTNMGGYELIIMAAPHAVHEHDPHLDAYKGTDKQAKLETWGEVEAAYNIKMTVKGFPETAPWGPARISWVIEQATKGDAQMDVFVSTTDWLIQFASANATVDVTEYYETYGKSAMTPAVRMASSYKGGLYSMVTGTYGAIQPYHGIFFNVNLIKNKGLDNPAELFNQGKWNWSEFKAYVNEASAVLGEGETVLSGKESGLFYGMVNAAGVSLVDPLNMSLNFDHPHAVGAAHLLREIVQVENMWGTSAFDQHNTSFMTGKSLMATAEYWFLKDSGRFPIDMWGDGTTHYGYVPFPYPDNMTKADTRVSYQGGAIYQMSTGREWNHNSGMDYGDVYRAFTELMLETTAKMKADPEIDEDLNMRTAASFKLDDDASIQAITHFKGNMVIYDPFYALVPSWQAAGPIGDKIAAGEDYTAVYTEYYNQFYTAMQEQFGSVS